MLTSATKTAKIYQQYYKITQITILIHQTTVMHDRDELTLSLTHQKLTMPTQIRCVRAPDRIGQGGPRPAQIW